MDSLKPSKQNHPFLAGSDVLNCSWRPASFACVSYVLRIHLHSEYSSGFLCFGGCWISENKMYFPRHQATQAICSWHETSDGLRLMFEWHKTKMSQNHQAGGSDANTEREFSHSIDNLSLYSWSFFHGGVKIFLSAFSSVSWYPSMSFKFRGYTLISPMTLCWLRYC